MTSSKDIPDTDLDDWTSTQQSALIADIASHLDVDAGLREILLTSRHAAVLEDVTDKLDIEAGLSAIVDTEETTPTVAEHPDALFQPPAATDIANTVVKLITTLPPETRLVLRTHPTIAGCIALAVAHTASREIINFLRVARALNLTHARDIARDLDRGLDRGLTRDIARDIARALDRALAHALAHDRDLDRARALALDLDRALDRALAHALDRALDRFNRPAHEAVAKPLAILRQTPSTDRATILVTLGDTLNDLVGADLSGVDLTDVPLDGIRWSLDTQWPPDWRAQIERDSESVPGTADIFIIRGGSHTETRV